MGHKGKSVIYVLYIATADGECAQTSCSEVKIVLSA